MRIFEVPYCDYCKKPHYPGVGIHKIVDGKRKLVKVPMKEITPLHARQPTLLERIICWWGGHLPGMLKGDDFQWCQRCNRRWRRK